MKYIGNIRKKQLGISIRENHQGITNTIELQVRGTAEKTNRPFNIRGSSENSLELTLTSGIQLTKTGDVSLQIIRQIFYAVQIVFDVRRRIERLDYCLIKHRHVLFSSLPKVRSRCDKTWLRTFAIPRIIYILYRPYGYAVCGSVRN